MIHEVCEWHTFELLISSLYQCEYARLKHLHIKAGSKKLARLFDIEILPVKLFI